MPSASEISEQVAREGARRRRLSVPAFAGGFLYLLSGIIITSTLNGGPTVGLLQGTAPALSGKAGAAGSPRTGEVKFASHHAFALIAGSVVAAVAIGALILILLLLCDAARSRRPQMWPAARPLILVGGVVLVLASVSHQVISAIETHNFAVGHDFSYHAVDQVLGPAKEPGSKGTASVIVAYLSLLAGLCFAAGMIATAINALRVGLVTRWMGILGIFTGVLIFFPIGGATLEVIPAFWMVAMGLLYAERWPNGDPPAWAAGEARPWPTRAELREVGEAAGGRVLATAGADVGPAPVKPVSGGSSRKRRRKRGTRG
jgi:hypothetical protein